jgi:ArsR family transcriptional regulator
MNIRKTADPEISPRFFKALCDDNRLAILRWLGEKGQACAVRDIACCCDVDLSVVSRHLALMREAGILRAEKRGKEVLYSVDAQSVVRLLRSLADWIERCCPPGCCETRPMKIGKETKR